MESAPPNETKESIEQAVEPESGERAGPSQAADPRQSVSRRRRSRRSPRSPFGWFIHLLAALGAPLQLLTLGLIGAAVFVNVTLPVLPDVEEGLRDVQLQEPMQVFTADGALIAEFGIQRRRPVAYDQVPRMVIDAFLATEDARFFEHGGIDAFGMVRALMSFASTGTKAQGGSTITMQVTRNFFLSPEKTFQRKLAELLLALHVESTLSKEEILELYLNKIFFGHRAYGISAAAALYYNKELDQLSVAEMAMLAGIPKAPSTNNPVSNPERARERRDYILGRMRELGYIDEAQYQVALATPDKAMLHRRQVDLEAGYVAEMARREIIKHYGEEAAQRGYRVTTTIQSWLQQAAQESVRKALRQYERRHGYRGAEAKTDLGGASDADMDAYLETVTGVPELVPGLVTQATKNMAEVYLGDGERTELDLSQVSWAREFRNANWRGPQPRRVSDVVAVGDLIRLRKTDKDRWELASIPGVSGALVSIAPRDGAVLALVGGYAFDDSKFNRAVDMRRQPGSSFKPFIYAAALNEGWTPASLLNDRAVTLQLGGGKRWTPKNYDHKEMGPIRMRKALALSRNLASINLLQSVGIEDTQAYLHKFGFETGAMPLGLSMALGTGEVSPVKMAEGFAVFANGGYHVLPYFISRIENGDGDLIYEANQPAACSDCWYRYEEGAPAQTGGTLGENRAELVIDPRIAYQMTSLLREVVERGTGTRAKRLKRSDIVGKTGTTNDVRDSWFCGYQADYVTVAWMGFDDFSKLGRGEEGGRAGLSLWTDFMAEALKDKPVAQLDLPPGMVTIQIDPNRGTEVRGKGGIAETVREEYRLMLMGPEPVKYAGSSTRKKSTSVKRSAPRVMDELF